MAEGQGPEQERIARRLEEIGAAVEAAPGGAWWLARLPLPAGTPGAPITLQPQGEDKHQQPEKADQESSLQILDQPQTLGVGQIDADQSGLEPRGVGGQAQGIAPGDQRSQQTDHRDEQRRGKEIRPPIRVPRPEAQPEMHADAAVDPSDDHHGELAQP